jgi:hypothetical protein
MTSKIRNVLRRDIASAVFPLFKKYAIPTIASARIRIKTETIAICTSTNVFPETDYAISFHL